MFTALGFDKLTYDRYRGRQVVASLTRKWAGGCLSRGNVIQVAMLRHKIGLGYLVQGR